MSFLRCAVTRMDARFWFFNQQICPQMCPQVVNAARLFLIPQTRWLGSLHPPVAQHLFALGSTVMGAPLSITRLCARRVRGGLERKGSGLFHPPARFTFHSLQTPAPSSQASSLRAAHRAGSGLGESTAAHSQNGLARVGFRSPTPGAQRFEAAPIHRNKLSRIRYPPLP